MGKRNVGAGFFSCPMPVALLGTYVRNRANFMAIAWFSRANATPPMLSVAINRRHLSCEGVLENGAFSLNLVTPGMMEKVDYCGLNSGRKVDKSGLFELFEGTVPTAPLITGSPMCIECLLFQHLELPTNILFVGEIVSTFVDEDFLTGGAPDVLKINPLLLTMPDNHYRVLGEKIGEAWKPGDKRGVEHIQTPGGQVSK